jgi:replication factor A1
MGEIADIYEDLETDVSESEFREAVEEKVEQMGGLADEETAAMLLAHELNDGEVETVSDIEPGMDEVKFRAKVMAIGDLKTFERDGEDEDGRVLNVDVADETGKIRLAFWDAQAVDINDGGLSVGDIIRVKGRPKDGYNGLEVSVDKAEPDEEATIDVAPSDGSTIATLTMGQSDVVVRGMVLDTDSVRTFDRDDGSEGRVSNLTIGDETGRVRVTLWDERADRATELDAGSSVEILDGYVRERDGSLELHVGEEGAVDEIDETVTFEPDAAPVEDVEIGQTVDIAGVVRSADPKRTFDRDDGSEGQVRNVRIQDETGDIRVALWGEKADKEIHPGDEVLVADVEIQDGWQDELEASASWDSTVVVLADGSTGSATGDEHNTGLSSFTDDTQSSEQSTTNGESTTATETEFTGTVVQTGDPVVLDDGEKTLSVETSQQVQLGEEVTVRGIHDGDRIDADDVI